MVVTLTMNPAIDKSTSVLSIVPEKKLRCCEVDVEAGGGGINVSKAFRELGGDSIAVFPAGGMNGRLLKEKLGDLHIRYESIYTAHETREDFTVTEAGSGNQFRFVMPGRELHPGEVAQCLERISSIVPRPSIVVVSGSMPPGVPDDFVAEVASLTRQLGARCIIDTSGMPLKLAAQEGVYMLKPNMSELCSLCETEYIEQEDVEEAAHKLIKKGHCEIMVISMGPLGAMLVTKDRTEYVSAPAVKKVSAVGAGDSMTAGMVWMLEQGGTLEEMVRFGVACGTAAIMNSGTHLFKKQTAWELFDVINANTRLTK